MEVWLQEIEPNWRGPPASQNLVLKTQTSPKGTFFFLWKELEKSEGMIMKCRVGIINNSSTRSVVACLW